jgi:hypothetical protein
VRSRGVSLFVTINLIPQNALKRFTALMKKIDLLFIVNGARNTIAVFVQLQPYPMTPYVRYKEQGFFPHCTKCYFKDKLIKCLLRSGLQNHLYTIETV